MTDPILAAEVAEAAARAGGAVLTRMLHDGDLEIGYKDARANLVTAADRESQRAVTDTILAAFPDHAVDGEEGTAGNMDSADVWYVDPLDGTTNYTHGLPFFCVSVALRSSEAPGSPGVPGGSAARRGGEARRGGDQTVAGAVYDPSRDEMFVGVRGGGAALNGTPVGVSDIARLDRALVVAQAQTVNPDEIFAYARLVERLMSVSGGVRSLGSPALTLCAIAAGRMDAYCEYSMDAWDILAGQLILSEAGGTLTLFDGQPHMTADRADVVASNGHIHAELTDALRALGA